MILLEQYDISYVWAPFDVNHTRNPMPKRLLPSVHLNGCMSMAANTVFVNDLPDTNNDTLNRKYIEVCLAQYTSHLFVTFFQSV